MTKSRLWLIAPGWCAILAGVLHAGCGGGPTAEIKSPPPPLPDFSISLSPSSTTISQSSTSSGIAVSVQALNGFSGDVQMTLSGMPAGVTANPQSPFTVPSGGSATVLIGAAASAAIGNSSISVQGASGSLIHSTTIALTVQSGTATAVPRSTYVRTDAQAALDDPAGEPHHRHMAYDAANRHLFVANRARNRVDILSTQDGSRVGSVDVPGASSADISPDGKTIW